MSILDRFRLDGKKALVTGAGEQVQPLAAIPLPSIRAMTTRLFRSFRLGVSG